MCHLDVYGFRYKFSELLYLVDRLWRQLFIPKWRNSAVLANYYFKSQKRQTSQFYDSLSNWLKTELYFSY